MTDHAHVKVQDAAIERQSLMREDQFRHFRWTNRTVRKAFWGVLIIPVGLYLTINATQHKWDWTGKRRGEPLSKS
ncbi:hypothetical protein C8R47DRAFT_1092045 [Mycena vitilis]|nr:hypothetical protein C8R47DRAFT_1092045 [Mycena vitilis]